MEAIDSVSSLRAIKQILDDEQSDEALELLAQEFPLTHIRAADAKSQLEVFLGIKEESASAGGSMDAQQMSMMQRQMQQQMQQMQQQAAQKGGAAGKAPREEGKVYLVANMRKNSVIAHAPPDKQAIIAAFIHRIDVAGDSAMSLDMLQNRMKTYRMASLNPEQLVNSLYNMDALEPMTRIEIDAKNKAIIVFASLVDHLLIEQVIKRLDGSAREFDVIQLRRLFAEDVAGTVKMMMGADEEEESQSSRYSYYYYNPRGSQEDQDKDKFRVAANVNDNQLLIWANELEREEINKLLIKLGELPPEGGSRSPYRTIDAAQMPETYEYLQRIQQRWQQMSDIPIVLPEKEIFQPPQETAQDPQTDEPASEAVAPSEEPAEESTGGDSVDDGKITEAEQEDSTVPLGVLAQLGEAQQTKRVSGEASPENRSSQEDKGSIRIGVDGRGNLILYSENTEALNALEALMMDVTPPKRPYDVVAVKHQTATWITYDLEDYFKDLDNAEKDEDPREVYYRYIFDLESGTSKEKPAQLGRKRPLRFIPSNDTQTILVIGADPETLETVKRLVELWDVPDKVDDTRVRYTQIVPIKYSRAELLVETMKEAFRDLLSSNDKAFQKNGDERGGGDRNGGAAALNSSSVTDEGGMDFSFSGRLSFGVDQVTNSILVSSEKQLLQLLVSTIEKLDEAAKPSGNVEVHQMNLGGQESLKEALKAILGAQDKAQKQPEGQQQPANQNGQPQVNANGNPSSAQPRSRSR